MQKFCILGIIILAIPLGIAVTVLVFVLLLFIARLPKSNSRDCICTRFVILVKKEQKNDRRTKKRIKMIGNEDYANNNKILQHLLTNGRQ